MHNHSKLVHCAANSRTIALTCGAQSTLCECSCEATPPFPDRGVAYKVTLQTGCGLGCKGSKCKFTCAMENRMVSAEMHVIPVD